MRIAIVGAGISGLSTAFYLQRAWLGRKSYTTVTGKGDSGVHPLMPRRLAWPVFAIDGLWGTFTVIVYGMIVYGSFVELWGVNNSLTFKHYVTAFSVAVNENGIHWRGAAWDSFWTTIYIAAVAAPLTAAYAAEMGMVITDMIIVGRLGSDELAAVGLTGDLFWILLLMGMGVIAMVGVVAAQCHGAGDRAGVEAVQTDLEMAM